MLSLEDQAKIIAVLLPYEPEYIGVFGSVARGEDGPESDVDILISLDKSWSLFDLVDIKEALSLQLHRQVDVATDKGLKSYIKDAIAKQLKVIYGTSPEWSLKGYS
jgi:uncharacterized protein